MPPAVSVPQLSDPHASERRLPQCVGLYSCRSTNRDEYGRNQQEPGPQTSLEGCDRLSVYSSRSLVGLHTFEGFPHFPLRDVERLCLVHGLLPSPVGPWPRLNNAAPSGSRPRWHAPHGAPRRRALG